MGTAFNMNLERISNVKLALCMNINLLCKAGRFVRSQIQRSTVVPNGGNVAIFGLGNAKKACLAVFGCASTVLAIFSFVNLSKVAKSVVKFVSVDVVNYGFGPLASDVHPCKTVGKIKTLINPDLRVSARINSTWSGANNGPATRYFSSEFASFSVVVQHYAKTLYGKGKISIAHVARSFLTMIWEVRPVVLAHTGLAHFNSPTSFVQRVNHG
jgi:hypothetical protein